MPIGFFERLTDATGEGGEQVNWFHNEPPLHGKCISRLRLGGKKQDMMDPKELRACIDAFVLLEPQLQLVELAGSWSRFENMGEQMSNRITDFSQVKCTDSMSAQEYYDSLVRLMSAHKWVKFEEAIEQARLEFSKAIIGEESEKNTMAQCPAEYSSHSDHHTKPASNWMPENYDLEKFKWNAKIDGYYEFALRRSATLGMPFIELLLLPRNTMRGPWCVARCTSDLKWNIDCDCSNINAIVFAVQKASVFLCDLLEQSARVKLPEDCEWLDLDGLCVRDSRSGTVFPVPKDARRADILDAVVKEFRRTH